MGDGASRSLADRVTGELPAGITGLRADQQQLLADALGDARRKQGQELTDAAEGALSYVPKLLRGPVRRAVGL